MEEGWGEVARRMMTKKRVVVKDSGLRGSNAEDDLGG